MSEATTSSTFVSGLAEVSVIVASLSGISIPSAATPCAAKKTAPSKTEAAPMLNFRMLYLQDFSQYLLSTKFSFLKSASAYILFKKNKSCRNMCDFFR